MYIHEGIYDYLDSLGAVSPVSIELEEDMGCYGQNYFGHICVSSVGFERKGSIIDRIRNGEGIRTPRFTPFNFFGLLVNKLSEKAQTWNGGLNIEETGARLDEKDTTKIAGALILAHEIGHSQRSQAIAHLMQIVGSYITIKEGFIDMIANPVNQSQNFSALIGGIGLCLGASVLSEILADNFAKRHAEGLLPYIITEEY